MLPTMSPIKLPIMGLKFEGVSVRGIFPVKIWELAVGAKSIVFVMLNRSRLG